MCGAFPLRLLLPASPLTQRCICRSWGYHSMDQVERYMHEFRSRRLPIDSFIMVKESVLVTGLMMNK